MNTNNNIYTVVYTTVVCVLVAAVLALASDKLGPKQRENEKAENISQILTAAQFGTKDEWQAKGNAAIVEFYRQNAEKAWIVNRDGRVVDSLDIDNAEVFGVPELKANNYKVKDGSDPALPVYIFKNGISVLAVYGAGLWGPVWGYIALDPQGKIAGAYFDHESETPGLGGKIKDDPSFRDSFKGKVFDFADSRPFAIVKGGAPEGKANAIDAISGATMTSKGVDEAVNNWIKAYRNYLEEE